MADEEETPAKLFLDDKMYPRFYFLKQRLLCIHKRFKAVIEAENLDDIVPDGKHLIQDIEEALQPIKETAAVYLIGSHKALPKETMNTVFVAASRYQSKGEITKMTLSDPVFQNMIKDIAERPGVIVHISGDGNCDAETSFEIASQKLSPMLPELAWKSCVLCTTKLNKFCVLDEFEASRKLISDDSLSKLIQSCLEDKVVRVLRLMADFIYKQLFLSEAESNVLQGRQSLRNTVLESLNAAVSETNMRPKIQEQESLADWGSEMVSYLSICVQDQICHTLSVRCMVHEATIREILRKDELKDVLESNIIERINYFPTNFTENEEFCKKIIERLSGNFKDFETKVLEKFQTIWKIGFEINGVFRQVKLPVDRSIVALSSCVQEKILNLQGVYGCGIMHGKLVVHLTEYGTADINEIANKVAELIKDTDCKDLVKNFEVTRVRLSANAGMVHESGNRIRVKTQNRQNVAGAGCASSSYCYGTVGCFVKGCKRNSSEKMYALSCAHVFPDGCDSDVEVGRTGSANQYDLFGKVMPKLKLLRKHTVDIAGIAVSAAAATKCNVKIKNSENCDAWENELHEGDLKSLIGLTVYKWGSASYQTRGLIISTDYKNIKEEALDERFNIYVGSLPGSSEGDFSRPGDSGSIICYDDPTEEKVTALSLLAGPLTDLVTEKTVCIYSCHLQKNIQELTKESGLSFELYK